MKMKLYHGRNDPAESLDNWGFDGPTLIDIEYMHWTYNATLTLGFKTEAAAKDAQTLTGWKFWDETTLEIEQHDDMIRTIGRNGSPHSYYGDYEISEDDCA